MLAERLACEFTVLPQLVSSILEMWMWGFFVLGFFTGKNGWQTADSPKY